MTQVETPTQTRTKATIHAVLFAAVAVLVIGLHSYHFAGRDYRDDEAWRIHAALDKNLSETIVWLAADIHPPLWQVSLEFWVDSFGDTEPIVRYLSTMYTVLSLALVYRLAADLFNRRIGVLAVLLLGIVPYFIFYSHEVRMYAALITATAGLLLMFLRWLRYQNFLYALLTVMFGIAALYTHFFGAFVVIGLALFFVLTVRWNPGLYVRAFSLFVLIGLSFLGWLLPFVSSLVRDVPEGLTYAEPTNWATLGLIYDWIGLNPAGIGLVIFVLGLVAPLAHVPLDRFHRLDENDLFWVGRWWRKLYVVLVPLAMLTAILLINLRVEILTHRGLVILLPPLAVVAALGVAALSPRLQAIVLAFLIVPAVLSFEDYDPPNGPYREMVAEIAETYQPGDAVVLDVDWAALHIPLYYYLSERASFEIGENQVFHALAPGQRWLTHMPIDLPFVLEVNPATANRLLSTINDAEHVWYIYRDGDSGFTPVFVELIQRNNFEVVSTERTPQPANDLPSFYITTLFRRVPDQEPFVFEDLFTLRSWSVSESETGLFLSEEGVQACDDIVVETGWRIDQPFDVDYGIALFLVGGDTGIVARTSGLLAGLNAADWEVGTINTDRRGLTVPCDTAPGNYSLLVGVFPPDRAGQDWALTEGQAIPAGGLGAVATVVVSE